MKLDISVDRFCECELSAHWRATLWAKPTPAVSGSVVGFFVTSSSGEPPPELPPSVNPENRIGPWPILQFDFVWRIGRPAWEHDRPSEASRSWVVEAIADVNLPPPPPVPDTSLDQPDVKVGSDEDDVESDTNDTPPEEDQKQSLEK